MRGRTMPIREFSQEELEVEAAAVRAEARAAYEHAQHLEIEAERIKRELGAAWQRAYALQDESARLRREARPHAANEAEEARLRAELAELNHDADKEDAA